MEQYPKTIVARAPGRINLIGEHTDYNLGLALPAAIDRYLYVVATRRRDDRLVLEAEGYEPMEKSLADVQPAPGAWHNYIQGGVAALLRRGFVLSGCSLSISSEIPAGAGLASSAALCCATVLALDALFGLGLDRREMALVAQEAEHHFAGVQCGLMDQYACLFGRAGQALLMDFSALTFEYVPLDLQEHELLLIHSGVKHPLAATAYHERKAECRRALALLQTQFAAVTKLGDATLEMLYDSVLVADPVAFKRARFVIEENQRVLETAAALRTSNWRSVAAAISRSHQGLSALYEVSCAELDLLVRLAGDHPSIMGARMMGGCFGGCTLNLRQWRHKEHFTRLRADYAERTGLKVETHIVKPADAARLLEPREYYALNRRKTRAAAIATL